MGTSVKYFHSAMSGAPTLNGTAGTMISVLDACLVNGFGLQTATSLVVASNVATLTLPTAPAMEVDTVVRVAGATPSGLNGDWRVTAVGANTVSFATTGISDQTASGTITAKLAPLDWAKPYNGTNLAAYRSGDVTGTRLYLNVDDTAAQNARVVGYETMTAVSTGTGLFPTAAQVSGGYYWPKANSTSATARTWLLVGDSRTFYLYTNTASSTADGWLGTFGDFTSYKAGDAYACMLVGTTTDRSTTTTSGTESCSHGYATSLTNAGTAVARAYTGFGSAILPVRRPESYGSSDTHSGSTNMAALYPNGPDNSVILSRINVLETTPSLRGVMRGLLFCPQGAAGSFALRDKLDGQGSYVNRKLLAIKGQGAPAGTTTTSGVNFIDITGDW